MQRVEELVCKSPRFPVSASLPSTIEQAFLDVQLLESKLDPDKTGKAMKRLGRRALTWPFTKKEVEEWVTRFQRLKATANLALTTDQSSIVIGVDTRVTRVREDQVVAERERQLAKLPFAASACFDSYHRQHETECIEDTRVNILERLEDWSTNHDRPLFWLSGMAGTGKSTVARTFAKRLESKRTLGGNFFFSRASGEASNAGNLVGTLARHLAEFSPDLKESISEAVASHEGVIRQGMRDQWKELIFKPLSAAILPDQTTLNIIIDALDDCLEVKDIKNVDLGIFITSRPEVVIRLGFDNMPAIIHQKLDLRDIPRHIVEHDISLLLDHEFDRIRQQHKLQDWPSEDDKRLLVQRSDCLFIYAKTVCRYIGDLDWDPEERLAEIIDRSTTKGGATAQLDAIYNHVLQQALIDLQSETQTAQLCGRFKRVVGSIVTLHDEISITALAKLLSITPWEVEKTLSRLHSVLNIPSDQRSPIRLLHPSFHDFLLDETRCRGQRFYVSETTMHSELTKNCLRVMSSALKRNICHLQTPGSPLQDIKQTILDENLPEHVQYSCMYWVDHLVGTISDDQARCGLRDNGEIHYFFQQKFLHWIELIEHQTLRAIVEDSRRFILYSRAVIEEAPLQVYASALVFSPSESLIRSCYADQLPSWLIKSPTVDRDWNNCVLAVETNLLRPLIAFSADGKYLASAGTMETAIIRLWDSDTGVLHSTLEGYQEKFRAIAYLQDGTFVSLSTHSTLRTWEHITGATRQILDSDLTYSPSNVGVPMTVTAKGNLAILFSDQAVRIWSFENESFSEPLNKDFKVHRLWGCLLQETFVMTVVRNGNYFVELLLLESDSGRTQTLTTFPEYGRYSHVACSDTIVTWVSSEGSTWLFDKVHDSSRELAIQSAPIPELAFCLNGRGLLACAQDGSLVLWDLSTHTQRLVGICSFCKTMIVSPNGKQVATLKDSFLQVWDLTIETRKEMHSTPMEHQLYLRLVVVN
ncbi:MAG: hypothetical protein Q9182_004825 [Xanthomendoza sp. 2 TL-2023]